MDHLPSQSLLSGNWLAQRELIDVGHVEFYQGCLSMPGRCLKHALSKYALSMLSFTLCASSTSPLVATWKINGVSTLSNIQFSKEGIGPCMKSIWRGTYKTNICAEI